MNNAKSELQHRLIQTEELLKNQAAITRQLQRMLWIVAHQAGGALEVDENALLDLWQWEPTRPHKDQQSIIRIEASTMPEPTANQIQQLAMRLANTQRHPGDDMTAVGLGDHPFSYVSRLLNPHVVMHEGTWMPKADYDALPEDQKTSNPSVP